MKTPLLSVCLITYNHANYIRQAIEGVLMQEVDFSWNLIIADDFSTDGTREILLEYKQKYPDFISLILQEKNVGPAQNWIDLLNKPNSKYIAYFEGDDYWTNPLKLKKQIEFLEENINYSLVFHNVLVKYEDMNGINHPFCSNYAETTTISDVIKNWYIPSVSMVFKRQYIEVVPAWFMNIYNGDYALHLILAHNGKIKYLDEIMGVYRKNMAALSGSYSTERNNNHLIKLFTFFNSYSNYSYTREIGKRINSFKLNNIRIKIKKMIYKIIPK